MMAVCLLADLTLGLQPALINCLAMDTVISIFASLFSFKSNSSIKEDQRN